MPKIGPPEHGGFFTLVRYEDNGDAVNIIAVMVQSTDKTSITGFGDPAKFLEDNKYLLGKQVFVGTRMKVLCSTRCGHQLAACHMHGQWYAAKALAACAGATRSEGGFAENKVSVASLLDVQEAKDQKGKAYYKYEILTRTGARFWPSFPLRMQDMLRRAHAHMQTASCSRRR